MGVQLDQKGYQKTEIGVIPKDWCVKRLKDIAEINKESLKGNTDKEYKFYYYDLSSVNKGKLLKPTEKIQFKNAPSRARRVFKRNNILMSTVRPYLQGFAYIDFESDDCICSTGFAVISGERPSDIKYIYHNLFSYTITNQIQRLLVGSNYPAINTEDVENLKIPYPNNKNERAEIASILSTWDKAIELKEKLIDHKKQQKKGLMQKLLTGEVRLPGFYGEWEKVSFSDIFIKTKVKKHQIKTNEYLESGKYPVVDQGQKKVTAYSNDEEKVFEVPETGVIVFGDHTREIKFIDFDFIIGADGTQVLMTKDDYDVRFYYYHLLIQKIPNTGYNRHFKFLKEMIFNKPSLKEQKAISNLLSTIDKELDLLNAELSALNEQKKGLMQLLLTGKVRVKV